MLETILSISAAEVSALVPEKYAAYRPIIADGISFFLKHLSEQRLKDILQDQIDLPADADVSTRLVRFMHASPALHKLGQVIARRRELDPALRRRLSELEMMEPRTPIGRIRPIVLDELKGAMSEHHIHLHEQALAEASVAVVVAFDWRQDGQTRHGVAKVLKPGVAELLGEDLEILAKLADFLDEDGARYDLPPVAYREVFDEVRELLTMEVQLDQEQRNLSAAAKQYAGNPRVQIPELLAFSTPRLTAMQRVFGVKVTELPGQRRDGCATRLANTMVRALLTEPFFSRERQAIIHADAHAGNLFAADDGRLAILDWSLAGALGENERVALAQFFLGVVGRDEQRIADAVADLSTQEVDRRQVRHHARQLLCTLPLWRIPDPDEVVRLLDTLALDGVRFSRDLLLFRKTYFTIEGVLADVCGGCSFGRMLAAAAVGGLLSDWHLRWFTPMLARTYRSRISTADLLQTSLAMMGAASCWRFC